VLSPVGDPDGVRRHALHAQLAAVDSEGDGFHLTRDGTAGRSLQSISRGGLLAGHRRMPMPGPYPIVLTAGRGAFHQQRSSLVVARHHARAGFRGRSAADRSPMASSSPSTCRPPTSSGEPVALTAIMLRLPGHLRSPRPGAVRLVPRPLPSRAFPLRRLQRPIRKSDRHRELHRRRLSRSICRRCWHRRTTFHHRQGGQLRAWPTSPEAGVGC